MPAVAMTDHGNLFGAVEFYNAARANGIRPDHRLRSLCLPAEPHRQVRYRTATTTSSCSARTGRLSQPHQAGLDGIPGRLLLQAAHRQGPARPALQGADRHVGLPPRRCRTRRCSTDRYEDARRIAYEYQDMFGKENFFLEIQDHGLDQDKLLPADVPPCRGTGIPLGGHQRLPLPAPRRRPHARDPALHPDGQDASTTRTACGSTRPEFYLKSRAEMMQLFGEVEDALDRTWEIAQRCDLRLDTVAEPFPKFEVPPEHSADTYFEYVARQGFERRRVRLEALAAQGRLKHRPGRVRRTAGSRDSDHPADEVLRATS